MKQLNHRFDTDLPFDKSIVDEFGLTEISDTAFDQAIEEFEITEDEGMDLLMGSEKYTFARLSSGWKIKEK